MRVIIGIQARSNSTRLPGKIYEKIGDKSILAHVYDTCLELINAETAVCILGHEKDEKLEEECAKMGIRIGCVLYGEEGDVLSRYVNISKHYDGIIRVTADCWNIPKEIIEMALQGLENTDYISNCLVRSYPEGWDVQGCTSKALEWIAKNAEDKEHVFEKFESNSIIRDEFLQDGFTFKYLIDRQNPIFQKNSIDLLEDLERARKQYGK